MDPKLPPPDHITVKISGFFEASASGRFAICGLILVLALFLLFNICSKPWPLGMG